MQVGHTAHYAPSSLIDVCREDLEEQAIDDPLGQPFTLATVPADLPTLAGAPVPTTIASLLGKPESTVASTVALGR